MLRPVFVSLLLMTGFAPGLVSACSVHDQLCSFHGVGRAVSNTINQNSPTAVVIGTISDPSINSPIDFDNNVLLPDGNGPYIVSTTGFPHRADQPYGDASERPRHVYPSQYQIDFQNGTAQATHSGDFNGGEIVPNAPGCTISTATYCEEVRIVGNIPDPGTPEGFVVKQTNHLYNFQGVESPYVDVISYGAATGRAYFKQDAHLGYSVPRNLDQEPMLFEETIQFSGVRREFLAGQGARGAEQTYYIGYDAFEPHAAGVVVHNNQQALVGSQVYGVQFGHQTPGGVFQYSGQQRHNTFTRFDRTYDFTQVRDTMGMPVLTLNDQETRRWTEVSPVYGVRENQAYLDHLDAQARRQASLEMEMRIAALMALPDYCSQPNGVCINAWDLPVLQNNDISFDIGDLPNDLDYTQRSGAGSTIETSVNPDINISTRDVAVGFVKDKAQGVIAIGGLVIVRDQATSDLLRLPYDFLVGTQPFEETLNTVDGLNILLSELDPQNPSEELGAQISTVTDFSALGYGIVKVGVKPLGNYIDTLSTTIRRQDNIDFPNNVNTINPNTPMGTSFAPNRAVPNGSAYSQADYDAYVQRKLDAGETPRSPEDYVQRRQQLDQNRADGARRQEEYRREMADIYGEENVLTERYLRNADGSIVRDPQTGEARRLDCVVVNGQCGTFTSEVTSPTANKAEQIAKEERIREQGGTFVENPNTGELIEVPLSNVERME